MRPSNWMVRHGFDLAWTSFAEGQQLSYMLKILLPLCQRQVKVGRMSA